MILKAETYARWLGSIPARCPPDFYTLLNLPAHEPDVGRIRAAVEALLARLNSAPESRTDRELAQLLREVEEARACLLHPPRKAAYDVRLRLEWALPPETRTGSGGRLGSRLGQFDSGGRFGPGMPHLARAQPAAGSGSAGVEEPLVEPIEVGDGRSADGATAASSGANAETQVNDLIELPFQAEPPDVVYIGLDAPVGESHGEGGPLDTPEVVSEPLEGDPWQTLAAAERPGDRTGVGGFSGWFLTACGVLLACAALGAWIRFDQNAANRLVGAPPEPQRSAKVSSPSRPVPISPQAAQPVPPAVVKTPPEATKELFRDPDPLARAVPIILPQDLTGPLTRLPPNQYRLAPLKYINEPVKKGQYSNQLGGLTAPPNAREYSAWILRSEASGRRYQQYPRACVWSADGQSLFMLNQESRVARISPHQPQIEASLVLDSQCLGLALSPIGLLILTAKSGLLVADPETLRVQSRFLIPSARGIVASPTQPLAFVSVVHGNHHQRRLVVLDLDQGIARDEVFLQASSDYGDQFRGGMAISADGRFLYLVHQEIYQYAIEGGELKFRSKTAPQVRLVSIPDLWLSHDGKMLALLDIHPHATLLRQPIPAPTSVFDVESLSGVPRSIKRSAPWSAAAFDFDVKARYFYAGEDDVLKVLSDKGTVLRSLEMPRPLRFGERRDIEEIYASPTGRYAVVHLSDRVSLLLEWRF